MEDIDKFFEYEKQDSLEEFILNFENYCFENENKNEIIEQLIRLFKMEKQDLSNFKKIETDEEHILQFHRQIRTIKKIISYLKSQKEMIVEEPKPEKVRLMAKKEQHSILQVKKRYKKEKKKVIFSSETIALKEQINNGKPIQELNLNQIIDLIKYYQLEKVKNIQKKTAFQKIQDSQNLDMIYIEIKKNNIILENLISYKNKLLEPEREKRKKENLNRLKLPISFEQIQELDSFYNMNTMNVLEMIINNNEGFKNDLEEVNQLLTIYKQQLYQEKTRKNTLIMERRKLIDKIKALDSTIKEENPLLEECNQMIREANVHMNILNNLLNYLKHYKKNKFSKDRNVGSVEFQDEVEISSEQEVIEDNILNNQSIESFDLKDILYGFGHYIKYRDIHKKTLDYAKEITTDCIHGEIDNEMIIDGIYYVWDAIKYRLANTPKDIEEARETRKNLKDIRILFDFVIKNYKENKEVVKHDYLFNIVDYLLEKEDHFPYLKNLVEKMPKIVNVRHINKDNKTSEHIVVYIVNKFVANYKKMLKSKNSYYINKDYLKEVYFLFTRCYQLYLTIDEKKLIDSTLANFMKEVNKNITSSKRKYAVKEDLKGMYTDKFYIDQKRNLLRNINDHKLEVQFNSFGTSIKRSIETTSRVDLTQETSIKLGSKYTAYSIQDRENDTVLKIHVIDLYDLFISYSELDKYLFNQTVTGEPIDHIITHQMDLIKNQIYPTITYEIIFDEKGKYKRENGHVDHFKIYKSKIQVKECYSNYDLVYSKGDVVLKSFTDLYRRSMIQNHFSYNSNYGLNDIEDYFEKILNQGIVEYFRFNHLPFIYSGSKTINSDEFIHIMNHIGHILSRLNETDFNVVYHTLEKTTDEFHYTTEPFDGDYQLAIKNPFSYPGLLIQRILHELVIDNKNNETEYERAIEKYQKELEETVMYLNYYNAYIDWEVLKANKGKLVKVKKMLF